MWNVIAAAAQGAPAQPEQARTALLLFLVVAALLAMLVAGVFLATISRRHRRNAKRSTEAKSDAVDPWHEAGARVKSD